VLTEYATGMSTVLAETDDEDYFFDFSPDECFVILQDAFFHGPLGVFTLAGEEEFRLDNVVSMGCCRLSEAE
jgi:hypothetical protein